MMCDLPLFPLNVVLFPGMRLPLHIFEERYRLMIGRCLSSDGMFGVALVANAGEGQLESICVNVGCSAEITESVILDDGRFNLQAIGRRRFRILSVREFDGYLIASVEWLEDDQVEEEAGPLANQALRSLRRYLGAIGTSIGDAGPLYGVPDNAHDLSMWIGILLALPNGHKQQLLELRSTAARLRQEVGLLRRAEIVQKAWTQRQTWTVPLGDVEAERSTSFSQFFSWN